MFFLRRLPFAHRQAMLVDVRLPPFAGWRFDVVFLGLPVWQKSAVAIFPAGHLELSPTAVTLWSLPVDFVPRPGFRPALSAQSGWVAAAATSGATANPLHAKAGRETPVRAKLETFCPTGVFRFL